MRGGYSYSKIAHSCPKFESIQQAQGFGTSIINCSRPHGPRCEQWTHWNGGACELFLAKGR